MKTVDLQLVAAPDVTIIPNSIIDNDMLEANELQLKVYLYILRNISARLPIQVALMADHFNETEKDIERALDFWKKRGVLNSTSSASAPVQAGAVPAVTVPMTSRNDFKPAVSKDDFGDIAFLAETYMKKPLTKTDLDTLLFIRENLSFSDELIEYLLEYCAERGKKSFKYVQTVALSWANAGITTAEEAKSSSAMYSKRVYIIMNALGKKAEPTNAELNYINRWYEQYGFEADVILEACRRTVLATDRNRFSYCEKILNSWFQSGVHHTTDINRADASYQTQKKNSDTPRKVPNYVASNPFLQFKQSDTDYDALEKELLYKE